MKSDVPNWAVESVNAPGQVWDPKKARVASRNRGLRHSRRHAHGFARHQRQNRRDAAPSTSPPRAAPPSSSIRSTFRYGFSRCEVRIDSADALPADDISLFAVERSDPQKVLFVHESSDTRSPLYFGAALAAAAESAFTMDSVPVAQAANVRPSDYAFVVLSDVVSLPASLENDLTRYVRAGGSVLDRRRHIRGRAPAHPSLRCECAEGAITTRAPAASLQTVGDTDPSYPSIGKADRWSGVKFYYAVKVEDAGSRVVARLTDQTPLLLEKTDRRRPRPATRFRPRQSHQRFPAAPRFRPVRRPDGALSFRHGAPQRIAPGRFVPRSAHQPRKQAVSVEVIDPQGRRPLSLKEATTAQTYQAHPSRLLRAAPRQWPPGRDRRQS